MDVEPVRVGWCCDWKVPSDKSVQPDALQLAFDEVYESGLIDRPIELLRRHVEGLPRGRSHAVLGAWKELADEGCVAIYGPNKSENVLALRPYIEEHGHVPTVTVAASDRNLGEWIFSLTGGSLSEEPYLMTNFLAHQGAHRVAVVHESTTTAEEQLRAFLAASRRDAIQTVHYEQVSPVQTDLTDVAKRLHEVDCDAIVYLGYGFPVIHLAAAMEAMDWHPLRLMGCAFQTAPTAPNGLASVKGWVGVDQYDEDNVVGQRMLDRFEARYGYRPANFLATYSYDAGQVLAHGVANARPLSPAGVRAGLEQVKWVPAATGGAGTLLNLAPYVHRAWLGTEFILLREAVAGTGDWNTAFPSVMRHRFTPIER